MESTRSSNQSAAVIPVRRKFSTYKTGNLARARKEFRRQRMVQRMRKDKTLDLEDLKVPGDKSPGSRKLSKLSIGSKPIESLSSTETKQANNDFGPKLSAQSNTDSAAPSAPKLNLFKKFRSGMKQFR